jgi:hypothetical protein
VGLITAALSCIKEFIPGAVAVPVQDILFEEEPKVTIAVHLLGLYARYNAGSDISRLDVFHFQHAKVAIRKTLLAGSQAFDYRKVTGYRISREEYDGHLVKLACISGAILPMSN